MDAHLQRLLTELAEFGERNDARAAARSGKMLNITPETGAFLALMVGATDARRVLEVGTSNGYSTLWLADAVRRQGGRVVTLELQPHKAEMARTNFDRAELSPWIDLWQGNAGEYLQAQPDGAFDLIFLDSERTAYCAWWPDLQRVLAPGGLLIVDNATSHAHELTDFLAMVEAAPGYQTSLLPLGKGELLILKPRS
jgi:predicted O-methyltransferase YrrM